MTEIRERARVTTFVRVDPQVAFDVFTQETDLWWRRGPRYRFAGTKTGVLRFESGPKGRLYEQFDDDIVEVGRILVWEPGARLVFEWRGRGFAPDDKTEVEVKFERADGGTRVVLEHRGWESIPLDRQVRHGLRGEAFVSMIGLWWGEVLTGMRAHASSSSTNL